MTGLGERAFLHIRWSEKAAAMCELSVFKQIGEHSEGWPKQTPSGV